MIRLEGSGARLDRFLFAPADARTAAVMRIALALMIAFAFPSSGLTPSTPATFIDGAARWYGRVFLTNWYASIIAALLVCFGAGYQSRLCGFALCVLLLPLASLSRGRESRLVLLCVLLAFSMLRSDARWSVRAWLARGRETLADVAGPMWPIRLIQIELTIVYAMNAYAKSTWPYVSGDVLIGLSRMRDNFAMDFSDGLVHLGPIGVPVALAAVGSVIAEAFLAIGFWSRRLRWITAVLGVAFHLVLQQILRIFMLDLVCMFLYAAFLLPWQRRSSATT